MRSHSYTPQFGKNYGNRTPLILQDDENDLDENDHADDDNDDDYGDDDGDDDDNDSDDDVAKRKRPNRRRLG